MLIGYARVSTDDQDTAAQVAALKAAGCERIFREKATGGRWDRPELHRLLDHLRKADVNDVALPLLEMFRGQISAPVHATTRTGQNVVQVRSPATAQSSDPIEITVQKPLRCGDGGGVATCRKESDRVDLEL